MNTTTPVPLPPNFERQTDNVKELIIKYLNHLDTIEQKAYCIGLNHLGSSFNLLKSNGYNDWLKKQPKL
jgi:hypothetical protein